jgi:hypothetical protein
MDAPRDRPARRISALPLESAITAIPLSLTDRIRRTGAQPNIFPNQIDRWLHSHDCPGKNARFSGDGSCTVIQGNRIWMLMISWALIGGLIGVSAAQRRRLSVVARHPRRAGTRPACRPHDWVSGVTRGDQRRLCLSCLEWIKANATVCRHCRRDLPQLRPKVRI